MVALIIIGAPLASVAFLWLLFKLEEKVSDESYL